MLFLNPLIFTGKVNMKQRIFGLVGLFICLLYVLFFGLEGIKETPYLNYSFGFMFLGSVFLISTDRKYE